MNRRFFLLIAGATLATTSLAASTAGAQETTSPSDRDSGPDEPATKSRGRSRRRRGRRRRCR
ncbi:MAG: hypothetical protein QGG36_31475 [Pirellulaceae bacterium]|nr:hypothetical protein [Pirellulaceae bacterium]MDP7020361.1 hypothetical protein [Pirellulaceae bacterium]